MSRRATNEPMSRAHRTPRSIASPRRRTGASRPVASLALLALLAPLVPLGGCQGGADCAAGQGRVEARLRACGVTLEAVELGGCSPAFAAALGCQAACAEAAPCEALDGSSPAARAAYLDCVTACG